MSTLANKRIVLGVCGSIAAYKSADLVRRLREAGAEVRVVMTTAAQRFVTALTFQAVSGHPVHTDLLDPASEAAMGHIELARWADGVLIAPASADALARLAHGHASDLLSAVCLVTTAPLAIAPAMNQAMWSHPATQANRAMLEARGVRFFGPASGEQACGEVGAGRLVEPADLVRLTAGLFESGLLAGRTVLVTAGPTYEDIDPVRYIGNRSSGRMGFALAQAAIEAGARVILVSGPVALPTPERAERLDVRSARQMHDAVLQHLAQADIFIGAAAVADYRPADYAEHKIKKSAAELKLRLTRNPDVLAAVASATPRPFTVGFAAETDHLEDHARAKLRAKGLDLICANRVDQPGTGFDSEENALLLLWEGGSLALAQAHKQQLARQLISIIAERLAARASQL